jgi:uncharacterized protein
MTQQNISAESGIAFIKAKVQAYFKNEGSGHDWWHIERVRKLALTIAQLEKADTVITELGALLHDVADHKLHGGDVEKGMELGKRWMTEAGFSEEVIGSVCEIMEHISYKGAEVDDVPLGIEGQVVRDADRLDAIGAVGIARTFAYGGSKSRLIYDPGVPPVMHSNFQDYKTSTAPTINHFYEKLLLLKDRMHTETARKMAAERHAFMELYLKQFFAEWEGKR